MLSPGVLAAFLVLIDDVAAVFALAELLRRGVVRICIGRPPFAGTW
jgi:hypothetical protein